MELGRRDDRARRARPDAPAPAAETPASILPGLPRVGSLDALLREVDSLRLTLETDLSLAAAAVEGGRPELAADIIDSDRDSLTRFEHRSLAHLRDLADEPTELTRRRRRVRVPALPFVAAAAVAGFLLGVVPQLSGGGDQDVTTAVSATTSLDALAVYAANGDTAQVRQAAQDLHEQLLDVVRNAGNDPLAAQQALLMLSFERDAIVKSGDSALLHDVLAQSAALTNRIRAALPRTIKHLPVGPSVTFTQPTQAPQPSSGPTAKSSSSPKPSASPTSAPSAKPSASSSPRPSASSSSDAGVLPTGPPVTP